jgi:hypothetical protein
VLLLPEPAVLPPPPLEVLSDPELPHPTTTNARAVIAASAANKPNRFIYFSFSFVVLSGSASKENRR